MASPSALSTSGALSAVLTPSAPDASGPPVLALEGVSKVFCSNLWQSSRYAVADLLIPSFKSNMARAGAAERPGEFFALENVDLAIGAGETVGVLGLHNSGKSTLAKVAGGLYPPDVGRVRAEGRRVLINSVAAGMRPMISLRENAVFRAALYGCDRSWVRAMLPAVLEFAGVADQADRPLFNVDPLHVKRLGQAIALHLDADLLVYDEALGFRQGPFREQALGRLAAQLRDKAALIVSKDLGVLASVCRRVIVLHDGRIVYDGGLADAVDKVQELAETEAGGSLTARRAASALMQTEEIEDDADAESGDDSLEAQVDDLAHTPSGQESPGFELIWFDMTGLRSGPKSRIWYLAHVGERMSFRMRVKSTQARYWNGLTIGLHIRREWRPFATFAMPSPGACQNGEEIEISGEFVVPPLMKAVYGLTLRPSDLEDAYSRTTALKLAPFVPIDAPRRGEGIEFQGEASIIERSPPPPEPETTE